MTLPLAPRVHIVAVSLFTLPFVAFVQRRRASVGCRAMPAPNRSSSHFVRRSVPRAPEPATAGSPCPLPVAVLAPLHRSGTTLLFNNLHTADTSVLIKVKRSYLHNIKQKQT